MIDRHDYSHLEDVVEPIEPIGFMVIVKPDLFPEKIGLIHMPEATLTRRESASETGVVLYIGPTCFKGRRDNPEGKATFKPGDRVSFARYSGIVMEWEDPANPGKYLKVYHLTDEAFLSRIHPNTKIKELR